MLPSTDVAAVLAGRPSLLLEGEWELVPAALVSLQSMFSDADVAALIEAEPVILTQDVDVLWRELQRCGTTRTVALKLRAWPSHAAAARPA